jgi:hypothetical protein
MEGTGWDAGADLNYLKQFIAYWLADFDWRKRETALNQFHHFKTEVADTGIHFIHERGKGAESVFARSHARLSGFLLSIREDNSDADRP